MNDLLENTFKSYLKSKRSKFNGNTFANQFRSEFPKVISEIIGDEVRYKVHGSTGRGKWSDCPWIAITDILITDSIQTGYYLIYIFKADMSGVYLSLNQGTTTILTNYKKGTKKVLRIQAADLRAKINVDPSDFDKIDLNASTIKSRLFEAGNIIAKYYPMDALPDEAQLKADLYHYIELYQELVFNEPLLSIDKELNALERKQYSLHFRIERNETIAALVKQSRWSVCSVCDFDFSNKYGSIGESFIEVHHLLPISDLGIGQKSISTGAQFTVLCSNCHSMIHQLDQPNDLEQLKAIILDCHDQRFL